MGSLERAASACTQIDSDLFMNLVAEGEGEPAYTIQLNPENLGTHVTLRYYFDRVQIKGCLSLVAPCMGKVLQARLRSRAKACWHQDMMRRGYLPSNAMHVRHH